MSSFLQRAKEAALQLQQQTTNKLGGTNANPSGAGAAAAPLSPGGVNNALPSSGSTGMSGSYPSIISTTYSRTPSEPKRPPADVVNASASVTQIADGETLLKDKLRLESDLKKAYAVIQKSKDTAFLNKLTEDNNRLNAELEEMTEYKQQITILREQLQLLLKQTADYETEVQTLRAQVQQKQSDSSEDVAKHDATADAMMRELELLRVSHLQDMERLDAEHQQHLRDEVKRASCSAAESVELAKQQLDAANADMQRLRLHAEELERQLQISVAAASASATAAAVEMHAVRDDAAIRDLEQRLLVAQEESEHVRTENATLHKTINTLTSERDALKVAAERRTAEVTLHATSAIAEELTAIKQELDQSHAQKTQLKEELDAARAQLSVAKMQNESDNALSQQRALQTHAEIELLRIQLTKLQADYDLVQKDNEVLLRKNAKLTEEAAYAGDQSELVQAQQMIEQLELANQQLDADFREKEHEWKAALEAKEREHRQALEKHELEAKRQLQAKEAELAGSMDKKYKGDKDQLAIVRKQLEDKERAIKQITQIQHDVESDYLKRIELLETTAKTATTELDVTKAQLLETQEKMHKLAVDNKAFSDQLGGVASQCEVLTAELAVARAGQERASNNLQEREESFKKLKQKYDESTRSQQELKAQCDQHEQDLLKLREELSAVQAKSSASADEQQKLHSEILALSEQKRAWDADAERLRAEKEAVDRKLADLEAEFKAQERRNAMLIKDYQKQMAKNQKSAQQSSAAAIAAADDDRFRPSGDAEADHRKMLAELQTLGKENGNLGRRLAEMQAEKSKTDEEIKAINERLAKMAKDLDTKSKLVLQYAMRENATRLQPTTAGSSTGLKQENKYLAMLSNSKVTQQLDPVVLSEINFKLQNVLEDLTTRNYELEEETRGLKELIRRKPPQ